MNQAFEGGLKEAYKVLTNQNPSRITPYKIEKYMQDTNLFKEKVLVQFTRYGEEWRNPSAHDHTFDFDESEAFLAIVSVCDFTNVLIDQISQHLPFEDASEVTVDEKAEIREHIEAGGTDLSNKVIGLFQKFVKNYKEL